MTTFFPSCLILRVQHVIFSFINSVTVKNFDPFISGLLLLKTFFWNIFYYSLLTLFLRHGIMRVTIFFRQNSTKLLFFFVFINDFVRIRAQDVSLCNKFRFCFSHHLRFLQLPLQIYRFEILARHWMICRCCPFPEYSATLI